MDSSDAPRTLLAAATAAPDEIPTSKPSSSANLFAIAMASSLETWSVNVVSRAAYCSCHSKRRGVRNSALPQSPEPVCKQSKLNVRKTQPGAKTA